MSFKRFVCLQLLTLFLSIVRLNGQSFTVSGFITNSASGEVLVGAYVFCPQTGAGTVTNTAGYYAISLPYGTKNIMYMAEGFAAKIDTTAINRKKQINVELRELFEDELQTNPYKNVGTIIDETEEPDTGDEEGTKKPKSKQLRNSQKVDTLIKMALARNIKIIDRIENGFVEVPGFQINQMPSLVGEVDVIRGLKFLPGAMPGTELTNGLYVRGGGQDQNLVLLDGAPVYNMNHLFGIYSVFNSDGINSINLTKSGFSSRYGGRLSSITDITMKEGNADRTTGLVSQSPISIRLELNGPLSADGKTTFAFAGRRSYLDLFTRLANDDSGKLWYTLYDFNAKICHRFNEKSKLTFSIFNCRDRIYLMNANTSVTSRVTYYSKEEIDQNYGNLISSLRWNRVINQNLFSSFSGSYSQYKYNYLYNIYSAIDTGQSGFDKSEYRYKFYNVVRDFTARADFDYIANKRNTLHFGSVISIKGFVPGTINRKFISNRKTVNDTNVVLVGNEYALYLEDEARITNNFKVSFGSRLVLYNYQDNDFVFLEPRVSFNARVNHQYSLKGSYTVMNQSIHSIANNMTSFTPSTDRWIPATGKTPPQRAQQFTLGISKPYNNNLELTIEGYYKYMSKVLEVKEGASFGLIDKNLEDKIIIGKGWSYGMEAFLHKKKGDLNGWISYSLSWAKRNTPGVNRGEDYYFQFDRRHYVNVVAQQKIDDQHSLSVNMVFSTGNVQSVPVGKYRDINGNIVYDYTFKNNYRLANTFRIDIGIKRIRDHSWGQESGYNISVYNVLARNNPAYVYILDAPAATTTNPKPQPTAYQVSFLKFLPGITYYTKF